MLVQRLGIKQNARRRLVLRSAFISGGSCSSAICRIISFGRSTNDMAVLFGLDGLFCEGVCVRGGIEFAVSIKDSIWELWLS